MEFQNLIYFDNISRERIEKVIGNAYNING